MKSKKIIGAMLFTTCLLNLNAQAPFTTLVKEPRFLRMITANRFVESDSATFVADSSFGGGLKSQKKEIEFFKSNSLSLTLLSKGDNRASINSQVLHYKLFVANPNEQNSYRKNRYNIPVLLITKLSSNYDSINSSSSLDVLDYEASPITVRIMPSFNKVFKTYTDVFYYGFYTDLRGLNIYRPSDNSHSIELVGSTGIGLTYQGDGEAGTYNENGEYEPGKYSISVIFQTAYGDKRVISNLFDTKNNYVTAIQTYFLFKVSEKSYLNLKVGYQYFFQKTVTGNRSMFSMALGI